MKRQKISISLCLLTIVAGITFAVAQSHHMQNQENDILSANVEALSNDEDDDTKGYSICYSESKVVVGYTYYDCGTCKKVYDEKGKGRYSKCFH